MDDQLQIFYTLTLVVIKYNTLFITTNKPDTYFSLMKCTVMYYYFDSIFFSFKIASFFCGIMALAVASNPFILIAVLVLGAAFIIVRWLYVSGTRNIKQLEALGMYV